MSAPVEKFALWLAEARAHKAIIEPTAMCLATVGAEGKPSARIVLLKAFDERGFVFYTNLESRKSRELYANPHAALCFYWMPLDRQVRIEGPIEPVSDVEADAYFATRPRMSRIGAWSSKQSYPLMHWTDLTGAVAENTARFEGRDIPRPPFWSGWRVIPQAVEFWEQGESRLHLREIYIRAGEDWEIKRLYP